jgi:hypothetical protein
MTTTTTTADANTRAGRCDALDRAIDEGRVIWGDWTREEDGRHLACLLAHLAPECGETRDASACPGDVLPPWLAHLTPWMDDNVSDAYRPALWREYARVVRRAAILTADDWRRLDYAARAIAVRDARPHAEGSQLAAIDGVLALLDRGAAGDWPSDDEMEQAARATWMAYAVTEAAAWAAANAPANAAATWAAARAAWTAAVAGEAGGAGGAGVWAAARTAASTAARAATTRAKAKDEKTAAADRITRAVLAAVDAACSTRWTEPPRSAYLIRRAAPQ